MRLLTRLLDLVLVSKNCVGNKMSSKLTEAKLTNSKCFSRNWERLLSKTRPNALKSIIAIIVYTITIADGLNLKRKGGSDGNN